jgi:hypothetical protein
MTLETKTKNAYTVALETTTTDSAVCLADANDYVLALYALDGSDHANEAFKIYTDLIHAHGGPREVN